MSENFTDKIFWNFNEINEKNILSGMPPLRLESIENLEITDGRKHAGLKINNAEINLGAYPDCLTQNAVSGYWCPFGFTLDFWLRVENFDYTKSTRIIGNTDVSDSNTGLIQL